MLVGGSYKMDFAQKIVYCYVLASCLYLSAEGSCTIEDRINGCVYTVICKAFAGPVSNPGCNGNSNVTFIMENSELPSLTHGFFSSTNFDSRVRTFIAHDNQWEYVHKYAMKYYRNSILVDMTQNNIRVLEDGTMLDLVYMKYLNLSHNIIETLNNKSLQVAESATSSLVILDLSNNRLSSIESSVLSYFPKLEALYLQNNKIQTLADTCFYSLKSLKHLMIQNNSISNINMTLVPLIELTWLDMSKNKITKLQGYEMMRLVSLIQLNMSHNKIESVDFNCFSQAFNLEVLDLSYNSICSTLEKVMFINNHNLHYLDLYQNNITTIGDLAFKYCDLKFLNLENNNITGDLNNNTFRGLDNIIFMNITNQHIDIINDNTFSEMGHLQYLSLRHNCIKIIANTSFINASSLTGLDISHNRISEIYFLEMFVSNLTEFYVNNNDIISIPENIFQNHNKLVKVDISANNIIRIEQNSLPLSNLQYLNLVHNDLNGTVVEKVFSPAKFLRYLNLNNFHLSRINDSALIGLPLVARLNLSHNDLEYIHPNNFKDLDNMFSLDISFNNLTSLDINTNLSTLMSINLNNNNFQSIPNIFGNNSKLEYLDISFNNISNLEDATFTTIKQVKNLQLSHNLITHFNNEYTNELVNLIDLNLASNQIRDVINMSFFKILRTVNMSNNDISSINSSQLINLNSLRILDLSGNKIAKLEPGTFQHLNPLWYLDLSSNFLTGLRFGIFRGLNDTNIINLSKNRLESINFAVFHECFHLKILIIDYNYITKVDMDRIAQVLPKLEVLSLGGNPIACEEIVRSMRKDSTSSRQINVTSLHQVYHEDNVHGIKCGDGVNGSSETTTAIATDAKKTVEDVPNASVLYIWCAVLSLALVAGLAAYLYKRRGTKHNINRESRIQFENSDLLN